MNIVIHIGWHKTGTTAIQVFLRNNANTLRHENKLYYPNEGLVGCAHHTIPWAVRGIEQSPWGKLNVADETVLVRQAIENAKKLGCQQVIFSSEEFCSFSEKDIVKLKEILAHGDNKIIIVAYIRRQDLLIESAYNMEVKWWGSRLTKDFQQYIKNKTPFIKYDLILDSWANVFGLENIKVRIYDTDFMPQKDIRLDFCQLAGIDSGNLTFDNKRSNTSLGPKSLAFLRLCNKFKMPRKLHEKIVSILQKCETSSKCVLFEPQQRIEFMDVLNDSNKNLAKFAVNPDLLTLKQDTASGKNENTRH